MINRYLKLYMFLTVLLSDFLMFADDNPGTDFEDENGNTDGSVEEAVPINAKLILLAIAGIAFVFYHFIQKKELQDSKSL